jgi:HEAT repeats
MSIKNGGITYLRLYIDKRESLLRGFAMEGGKAIQPLLDYRKKVLPTVSYSQARLDSFLKTEFAVIPNLLYEVSAPISIPNILNRKKYPDLERFSGPSFTQEHIRLSLKRMETENQPPNADDILMGLDPQRYPEMIEALDRNEFERMDLMVIHQDPSVRANLAWLLAKRKDPLMVPVVFELMKDQNPEVRRIAVIAAANFTIKDTQGSSDPKFIQILKMLQNYRSNSDAFGRSWAVIALSGLGDKHKALYILDLILNDGNENQSDVGQSSPNLSDEEQETVTSLIKTLRKTPEEVLVKNQALNSLLAIQSPEVLDILLHYLNHVYQVNETRPSMLRYLVPHLSLPQEAENVEDVIFYLSKVHRNETGGFQKRQLKALTFQLNEAYRSNKSGEFFQLVSFLEGFDPEGYQNYLVQNAEQIRIMTIFEYFSSTRYLWIIFWVVSLLFTYGFSYFILPLFQLEGIGSGGFSANPAMKSANSHASLPTIVPIKIRTMDVDLDD